MKLAAQQRMDDSTSSIIAQASRDDDGGRGALPDFEAGPKPGSRLMFVSSSSSEKSSPVSEEHGTGTSGDSLHELLFDLEYLDNTTHECTKVQGTAASIEAEPSDSLLVSEDESERTIGNAAAMVRVYL